MGSTLRCIPVRAIWEITLPARCIDFAAFFLGLELFNCILDVIMLSLPVGVIRDLHLPVMQRVQLSMIFLLGGL